MWAILSLFWIRHLCGIKSKDKKLKDFLAQAFIIRDNEEISIPRALLIRIHSVALKEIEHCEGNNGAT